MTDDIDNETAHKVAHLIDQVHSRYGFRPETTHAAALVMFDQNRETTKKEILLTAEVSDRILRFHEEREMMVPHEREQEFS